MREPERSVGHTGFPRRSAPGAWVSVVAGRGREGRYRLGLIALLSLNYGIVFFDRNALGFLMPFIQPELGLTGTQIGLLSSALALTWALSAVAVGRLSDRLGNRKGLLLLSTLIFSVCSAITGLASNFAMLLGARLVMGVSEGGVLPVSQAMISGAVSSRHRGLAMGVTQNLGSSLLGTFVAPIILVSIAVRQGWRSAFLLAAVPGFILVVTMLVFIRRDALVPTGEARANISAAELLAHRNILLCALIAIVCVAYFLISMAFLPLYLVQARAVAPTTMAWLLAVLGIASTVNSVLLSTLADRFGRRPVMLFGSALGVLVPFGALFYSGPPLGLALLFGVGWTPIALFPLFMATIPSETVGPAQAATVIGLIMAVGEVVGGVLFPVFAGVASDRFGSGSTMWILGGLCVVATMLALGLQETAPGRQGVR